MYGAPGVTPLLTALPGLDVLVLSRFGLIVTFAATWLAALGADALVASRRGVPAWPAMATAGAMATLVAGAWLYLDRVLRANAPRGCDPRVDGGRGRPVRGHAVARPSPAPRARHGSRVRLRPDAAGVPRPRRVRVGLPPDRRSSRWCSHDCPSSSTSPAIAGCSASTGWANALSPERGHRPPALRPADYDGIGPRAVGRAARHGAAQLASTTTSDPGAFPAAGPPRRPLRLHDAGRLAARPITSRASMRVLRHSGAIERSFPARVPRERFIVTRDAARSAPSCADGRWIPSTRRCSRPGPDRQAARARGGWGGARCGVRRGPPLPGRVRRGRHDSRHRNPTARPDRQLPSPDGPRPWTDVPHACCAPTRAAGRAVPPGEHMVQFSYRPTSLIVGGAISSLALVVMVVGLAVRRGPRRMASPGAPGTRPSAPPRARHRRASGTSAP